MIKNHFLQLLFVNEGGETKALKVFGGRHEETNSGLVISEDPEADG